MRKRLLDDFQRRGGKGQGRGRKREVNFCIACSGRIFGMGQWRTSDGALGSGVRVDWRLAGC
jgi:hypothetical protein